MSLTDMTKTVGEWHLRRWGDPGAVTLAAKLAEEVGEVCEAAVKVAQGHPRAHLMNLGDELADVLIVAMACAYLEGIDLAAAVDSKVTLLLEAEADGHRDHQNGERS